MGIANKRRFKKEVKRLAKLAEEDINSFLKVWNKRTSDWLEEMHKIAEKLRSEGTQEINQIITAKNAQKVKGETQTISKVWKRADDLIKACGEKVETLVGIQTRRLLDAECSKLIAQVYEPRTYRMTSAYQRLQDLKAKRKNPN